MAPVVLRTEQVDILEVGDVFVVRWYRTPTITALREIEEAMNPALERHPHGFGWLAIPCSQGPKESGFADFAGAQVDRMKVKGLRAIAAVQDDDSVGGTLARVAIQLIDALSRGVSTRVFRYLPAACVWMAANLPGVDAVVLEREARQPRT